MGFEPWAGLQLFLVRWGQGRIVKDRFGSTKTFTRRTEVGERKTVQILGFVADCSKGKSPVTEAQTAAIPIVDSLNAGILDRTIHKIVPAIRRQIETHRIRLSDLDERLQLLTLKDGGGAAFLVDRI